RRDGRHPGSAGGRGRDLRRRPRSTAETAPSRRPRRADDRDCEEATRLRAVRAGDAAVDGLDRVTSKEGPMATTSKAVLITGCSTGIGRATAILLASKGWSVYATARKLEAIKDLEAKGCKTLALDVCDDASMQAAVAAVER